ncbi:sigma-54-dependent Fis family transcriptional regulator [candidate division KSB1 bacterium]|nr:sigma-54-dependent Fis family transcriptional regulator [candidate division KSB1 bacterium]
MKTSANIDRTMFCCLLESSKRLLMESEVDRLLTVAVDLALELAGASRGMIVLFGGNDDLLFETARNLNKENISHPEFEISRTLIAKARAEGRPLCLPSLSASYLSINPQLTSQPDLAVICIPLRYEHRIFGVVYLDQRADLHPFDEQTCVFLQEFAEYIALACYHALERRKLYHHACGLEQELRARHRLDAIVGHHPKMITLLKTVTQVADTEVTVLIQGESGTGKELVAHALHYNSRRRDHPFVPVNCAALPEHLLESELFGHVRGAFTGAIKDKPGWFERAQGGTIFLDEVNEMTLPLQVKLLRVLQEGEYSRVGSTELRHVDVRVLAASSNDLKVLMEHGRFREELYYRLNVVDIWVPPLRERKCDILLLARHFLKLYGEKFGKHDLRFAPETETVMLAYDYPGNVRELENMIQRAVVLVEDKIITPALLPPVIINLQQSHEGNKSSFKLAKACALQKFEREYLAECLLASRGCITSAAHIAGMDVKNFYAKMKRLGLDPHAFKVVT